MTKFIDGSKRNEPKKERKETVFTHFVDGRREVMDTKSQPKNFDNVEFLFHDEEYGDVFKAWDDSDDKMILLYFGTKGDEYYEKC